MHVHAHGEGHAGHAHTHFGKMSGVLEISVVATITLVVVELAGGYLGHSISLISDAVHNLTDLPTMVISWLALRWSERPPDHEKTYGYHRAGILAAFANAIILALVAGYILFEAYERLRHPVEVHSGVMIWVSVAALAVNGAITLALVSGRRDLNLRSVFLHNLGDALSNIAILAGALAIRWLGVQWIDAVIGLAIGLAVLWSGYGILRESTHILLEGLPRHIHLEEVARAILRIPGVQEVHDIHIWTLGTDLQALSCHVRIPDMHMEESERILAQVLECLEREFHISHTTIQFERAGLPANGGFYMPAPARQPLK